MLKKIIVLGICFTLFVFFFWNGILERFIFQTGSSDPNHIYSLDMPFDEIFIDTNDGATLHMMHIKCDKPRFTIVYFHGNRGNLQRWADIASKLTKFGCEVFVMDYRGYGKSTGLRSEAALYRDANEVLEYVKNNTSLPVILYGRSLGTGIASWLAAHAQVDGLILESPYYNFETLVYDFIFLPNGVKKKLPLNYRFDNFSNLKELDIDILILHGAKDKVIGVSHARDLKNKLENPKIEYVEFRNGDHFNLDGCEEYRPALERYFSMLINS